MNQQMPEWPEDLSSWSLDELQRCRTEYRAMAAQLRQEAAALINRRLAKQISMEDYVSGRKLEAESASECKRRSVALENEIATRRSGPARR